MQTHTLFGVGPGQVVEDQGVAWSAAQGALVVFDSALGSLVLVVESGDVDGVYHPGCQRPGKGGIGLGVMVEAQLAVAQDQEQLGIFWLQVQRRSERGFGLAKASAIDQYLAELDAGEEVVVVEFDGAR